MYLAYKRNDGVTTYYLRQSRKLPSSPYYQSHDVVELGANPADHIKDIDSVYFTFREELIKAVEEVVSADPDQVLEELLYDFLDPFVRIQLEKFGSKKEYTITPLTEKELDLISREVHLFDMRRIYFIRYGAVDQRHIHKMHKKLARKLLGMSRDEKEFFFLQEEKSLNVRELKTYVYAVFDLQSHFRQSFAPMMPAGLPQQELEGYFLQEICNLSQDDTFLQGEQSSFSLYHHLQRYVIMFFDEEFPSPSFFNDFARDFMRRHRHFSWPERKKTFSSGEYEEIMGKSLQELKKMNQKELSRLYRQAAKKLHPDQGGDHEKFIRLTEAYKNLTG